MCGSQEVQAAERKVIPPHWLFSGQASLLSTKYDLKYDN